MDRSAEPAPATGPGAPYATVLAHLAQPVDPARLLEALLGLSPRQARHVAGLSLATSPEAERLLAAMPRIVRSMAIATTDRAERCYGELRGPVLWAETVSARTASAGDPGLYVCATTRKAYDTDENRVLKAALAAIARAAAHVDPTSPLAATEERAPRRARSNGQAAAHLLEHRTLADVPVTRVRPRALQRTRAGSRRGTYEPAVALLRRAAQPLTPALLAEVADEAAAGQVSTLAAVLDAWPRPGDRPVLRTAHGAIVAGAIRYERLTGTTVAGVPVPSAAAAPAIVAEAVRASASSSAGR